MQNIAFYKKEHVKVNKKSKYWKNFSKNLNTLFSETNKKKSKFLLKLHEPSFGVDEIKAFNEVLISTQVTMGKLVEKFEKKYGDIYNYKYSISNNSGSSANLLAISALTNFDFKKRLKQGDEVIVPALAWSTTIWPLVQHGLVPKFVDIDRETLNIDPKKIEAAITKKTKAIMLIHVYGNPCDMDKIIKICKKKKLLLIEDSCESMGAKYKKKSVGSFGCIGTFSFYYSHHATTLEGGICVTNDRLLSNLMKVQRSHGWIRGIKYSKKTSKLFDKNFTFVNTGYNLRLTEPQGAFGIEQLKKIKKFVKIRREFANNMHKFLDKYSKYITYQKEQINGKSSYFGLIIVVKKNKYFSKNDLIKFLNKNMIETRPVICGNFTKQPAMKMIKHIVSGKLKNTDYIMQNAFSIGCHQNIDKLTEKKVMDIFDKFLRNYI